MAFRKLDRLEAGASLVVDGNRALTVSAELAERFRSGDRLLADAQGGELLHLPAAVYERSRRAVNAALDAWHSVKASSEEQRRTFFLLAADRLESDEVWSKVAQASVQDLQDARSRGRSTGRLELSDEVRSSMSQGLRGWGGRVRAVHVSIDVVDNPRGRVELIRAPLGVVGFVFESRPNVLVDACGVVATGNVAVLRIGSDAIRTARACLDWVIEPSLRDAGLAQKAVALLDDPSHEAAWALFSDSRLALAVARGSGRTTQLLGSIARQMGTPVSMHGTGGAWLFTSDSTKAAELTRAVVDSLDRKVCNTLNTICLSRSSVARLVPALLDGLRAGGARRGGGYLAHVVKGGEEVLPVGVRDSGVIDLVDLEAVGREWEWSDTPEVAVVVVSSLGEGVELFNRHSPRFVASLLSSDASEQREFFETVESPFVGDGYTRWVDGQFALDRPELGLSNWEHGRLFGRSGILSGEDLYTVRLRFTGRR